MACKTKRNIRIQNYKKKKKEKNVLDMEKDFYFTCHYCYHNIGILGGNNEMDTDEVKW